MTVLPTIVTFQPPLWPSPGATQKRDMKILRAEFGDGYSEATPDGLNHVRRTLDLRWDVLETCDRDKIIKFLDDRKGVEPFYFALPGQDQMRYVAQAQPWHGSIGVRHSKDNGRHVIAWTCDTYTDTAIATDLWQIDATFRQYFGGAV